VLGEQVCVLRYVSVIKVGYPKVQNDGEQEREVEDGKVNTIAGIPYIVLNEPIYPENIDGLDKQVKK
jgi:hypothetical protein